MITKLLITVKTYPALTTKYEESVCTAGVTEEGKWIRIYPIRYRKLNYAKQYKKYDWIEIDIVKHTSDFRPESYRPVSIDTNINIIGHLDTKNNWCERKKYILKDVYSDLEILIKEAKEKKKYKSLAVFGPSEILDFKFTSINREWDIKKLKKLEQLNIFESPGKVIPKLPYKFFYIFKDIRGKQSTMMIEDWEVGALYWKGLLLKGSEESALNYVKDKYLNELLKKCDIYFFLGTTRNHHLTSKNPFMIVVVFYPLKTDNFQASLF